MKYIETIQGLNLEMKRIAGGTFLMGSPETSLAYRSDERQHTVTLGDFYIGVYPVTQAQWARVMGNNPSRFKGDSLPVEQVSWYDVQYFLGEINTQTRRSYRLPTEAEWEYAARGGTTTEFYTGDGLTTEQANFDGNYLSVNCKIGVYREITTPVGTFAPNQYGLYDMYGNVWEWCSDWYAANYYQKSPIYNPNGPTLGYHHVQRGGSWYSEAHRCSSVYRSYRSYADSYSGFRLAL